MSIDIKVYLEGIEDQYEKHKLVPLLSGMDRPIFKTDFTVKKIVLVPEL